jgi:quinol monooxygenase YgiN
MITVTVWGRARSAQADSDVCRLFVQAVARTQSTGWIRGRCFVDATDRQRFLFLEEWATRQSFDAWISSDARGAALQELSPLLEGDLRIDVWEEM